MSTASQGPSGGTPSGPSSTGLRATSSGRITGGWVRAVTLPTAKGFSRGYDRKAVDALLLQCANGVDWLSGLLIGAENEIERLTAPAPVRSMLRSTGRTPVSSSHGKRSGQVKVVAKRSRLRSAARPGRPRP